MTFTRSLAVLAIVASALAGSPASAADLVRVGEGPFITGGGFYVALERGYFKKMDLDIQIKKFNDGALAVPSMLSGELDITFMTAGAGFFNSVAKGAPMVMVLDRGNNKPGFGYSVTNVSNTLYNALAQSDKQPLALGITIHSFIVGQPFRLRQFRRVLDHVSRKAGSIWFTTAGQIAECYAAVVPPK